MTELIKFDDLIRLGDELLMTSIIKEHPGVRSTNVVTRETTVRGPRRKYRVIDSVKAKSWAVSCLAFIEKLRGKESYEYQEFKKASDAMSYEGVRAGIGVLVGLKNNFESGITSIQPPVSSSANLSVSDLRVPGIAEARRNTRRILVELLLLFLAFSGLFIYIFGAAYAFVISLAIVVIGYVLSGIFLSDWSPTKLSERLMEYETKRLYKQFAVRVDSDL